MGGGERRPLESWGGRLSVWSGTGEMTNTTEDVRDFEIFNISDQVNVLAYSTMALGNVQLSLSSSWRE